MLVLVLLVAGAGGAIAPSPASAGTYHVFLCHTPDGGAVPAHVDFSYPPYSYIWANDHCTDGGDGLVLGLGSDLRGANDTIVRAMVNAKTPIVRVDATRTGYTLPGTDADWNGSPYSDFVVTGSGYHVADGGTGLCAYYAGCLTLGAGSSANVTFDGFSSTSVGWEVGCGGVKPGYCYQGVSGVQRAYLAVTAMHLYLRDDDPPAISVTSGSAVSAGNHSGRESAAFSASDWGSGVLRVEALLDGKLAGSAASPGACYDRGYVKGSVSLTAPDACPADRTSTVPVDTTVVPDGRHTLQIRSVDVAGNVSAAHETRIDIDNVPTPKATTPPTLGSPAFPNALRPGDVLTATNGVWSIPGLSFSYRWQRYDASTWTDIPGATASTYTLTKDDIDARVRVVVTAKNVEGSVEAMSEATGVIKSGATVTVSSLGPNVSNAPSADSSSPQLVLDREQRSVEVKYGAKIVVTGKLVDSGGSPIADADVDVFEQVSVVGSPWRKIATIKTDSQGGYVFRPTTTGSRVLRFAYSASRDTGEYRATREVVIGVTAGMNVRAVKRSIPARGVIRLHGQVLAQPLPAKGAWVEVQVLDAGVWRTVATCRTSPTGRWSYKHRVRQSSHVTFAFRARLRQLGDVPALESKSATVKVHVR